MPVSYLLQSVFPSLSQIEIHGYLLTLLVKFAMDYQYQWNMVASNLNIKVPNVIESGYQGHNLTEEECKDLFHLIIKDFRTFRRYPESVPQAEFLNELIDMMHSAVVMDIKYDLQIKKKHISVHSDPLDQSIITNEIDSQTETEMNDALLPIKKLKNKSKKNRKADLMDPIIKRRKTDSSTESLSNAAPTSKNLKRVLLLAVQEMEDHKLGYLFVVMKKNYDAHPHGCKKGLDLKTIKANVTKGIYLSILQFFEDCMLMIANIVMLCPEDAVVKDNANLMMRFIQEKFSIMAAAHVDEKALR